jgi:hypothetical protein
MAASCTEKFFSIYIAKNLADRAVAVEEECRQALALRPLAQAIAPVL